LSLGKGGDDESRWHSYNKTGFFGRVRSEEGVPGQRFYKNGGVMWARKLYEATILPK